MNPPLLSIVNSFRSTKDWGFECDALLSLGAGGEGASGAEPWICYGLGAPDLQVDSLILPRGWPGRQFGTMAPRVMWPSSCCRNASLICASGNLWDRILWNGYFDLVRTIRSSAPFRCSAS